MKQRGQAASSGSKTKAPGSAGGYLLAQIALGVIIGGLALALLVTGFTMWMQGPKKGKERLAVELLVAGAIIVVVLIAIAVIQ